MLGSPAGGKDGAAMGITDGGQGGRERRGVGSKVGSWSRSDNCRLSEGRGGWKETPLNHDASLSHHHLHPNLVVLRLSHPVKEFWNTVATQFFYG